MPLWGDPQQWNQYQTQRRYSNSSWFAALWLANSWSIDGLSWMNYHELSWMNYHELSWMNYHELSWMTYHELSWMNNHELSWMNYNELSWMNYNELSWMNYNELSWMNYHELSWTNYHELSWMNYHELSSMKYSPLYRNKNATQQWNPQQQLAVAAAAIALAAAATAGRITCTHLTRAVMTVRDCATVVNLRSSLMRDQFQKNLLSTFSVVATHLDRCMCK